MTAGPRLDDTGVISPNGTSPLAHVVATFRRWLHLPDAGALYVLLGTVAANRMPGDPVWTLFVGPPGSGKTELLHSVERLPEVHAAATLTEAALLSGTPKKERADGAKGGLLRDVGEFGLILCKDFGSVLSMNRETRAGVLAALREVYDGAWTRHLGVAGGVTLHWHGKLGLIAGVTPTIDGHHAVMGSMGERFALYRLPESDEAEQAARALSHAGHEAAMRAQLADVVLDLFRGLDLGRPNEWLTPAESARLIEVARLAVRCRSAVERHGYSREIELIPAPEAPGRMALVLARLLAGMTAIGVDRVEAWRLVVKTALDSMPALRHRVLEIVLANPEPAVTATAVVTAGYPTTTALRALEDLAAHHVLERTSSGTGRADLWTPTAWTRERWKATSPEMSDGVQHRSSPETSVPT